MYCVMLASPSPQLCHRVWAEYLQGNPVSAQNPGPPPCSLARVAFNFASLRAAVRRVVLAKLNDWKSVWLVFDLPRLKFSIKIALAVTLSCIFCLIPALRSTFNYFVWGAVQALVPTTHITPGDCVNVT